MMLRETLGTLPSGSTVSLTSDDLSKFLRENYLFNDQEAKRIKRSQNRLLLYRDQGHDLVEEMVNKLFRNQTVKRLRKQLIDFAMFQNVTKRVVREISMVYSSEAMRSVESGNDPYQDVLRICRQDRKMRSLNRLVNLLNEALVWFDIRGNDPVLRIIDPSKFFAVCHPNDPSHHVASIIDIESNGIDKSITAPKWLVISEDEFFKIDKDGRILSDTYHKHGLGVMPALLVHREEPEDRLLDSSTGEDLISAHLAVALLNVLMLKQSKSAERVVAASGDLSTTPNNQPLDQEVVQNFGEGISLSTLDLSAKPSGFIEAARSVIKQCASNYGIPESVFDLSFAASSGFEIDLKRSSLKEIRQDQTLDYRFTERKLVEIQSRVLNAAGHPLRFENTGWQVNFGEVQPPRHPRQMLQFWGELRQMGLMNTVEMYMRLNPEATIEQAQEALLANADIEAKRVDLLRKLNVSPSNGPDDPGMTPQENGKIGGGLTIVKTTGDL